MKPSQKQLCILVTGATSGIGEAAAELFSLKGHKVIIHGRTESEARQACRGNSAYAPVWGDLADLKQVRRLAKQIEKTAKKINVAILNAGIFQSGGKLSADGFELDFAVNYLSQLLLISLLLEQAVLNPSRIIFVSSSAYINGKVDLSLLGKQYLNDPMMAYATSKQLCLVAALELSRRLAGTGVCVNACNPGPTATNLLAAGRKYGWRNSGGLPVKAARRLEWLALSPEIASVSGRYFNGKKTPNVPKRLRDGKFMSNVYEASMRLCGKR